jgi:hypothetical protein
MGDKEELYIPISAGRAETVESSEARIAPKRLYSGPIVSLEKLAALMAVAMVITCPRTGLPISTSLRPTAWFNLLAKYPDRSWSRRLVADIIYGVDIGFRGSRKTRIDCRNMPLTDEESEAITQHLAEESALARLAGPYDQPPWDHFWCSPLKTVPKKSSTKKFRIVHHLSYPHGNSVNSHTAEWDCYLSHFDDAIEIVRQVGRGCFMSKVDIKAAYHCIPVRPADWSVLGMRWEQKYYFHKTLPFGLTTSCHLWERYSSAAEWILRAEGGVQHITHYVDDFFIADSSKALLEADLAVVDRLFLRLGLPVSVRLDPTTTIIFLGFEIDSRELVIRLGDARRKEIAATLRDWVGRETCSARELQTLVGILQWACRVIRHGRTFLQRMYDMLLPHVNSKHPFDSSAIELENVFQEDLEWWSLFMDKWNGVTLITDQDWMTEGHPLQPHTDASSSGYGAVCGRSWFHGQWTGEQESWSREATANRDSMPFKELFAVVTAALTWGSQWGRKKVVFRVDCLPVVQAVQKGATRQRRMMQLLRALHHCAALHHFDYRIVHIAGVDNVIADELSRVFSVSQLSQTCRQLIDPSPVMAALPLIQE